MNELREALDKLVEERPELGEYDVLSQCGGSDCGYTAWGGTLHDFSHPSIKMQHVVLGFNPNEEDPL